MLQQTFEKKNMISSSGYFLVLNKHSYANNSNAFLLKNLVITNMLVLLKHCYSASSIFYDLLQSNYEYNKQKYLQSYCNQYVCVGPGVLSEVDISRGTTGP